MSKNLIAVLIHHHHKLLNQFFDYIWHVKKGRNKRLIDHSSPSSAEVKNGGAIPPLPHMFSWYKALLIKHRGNITFYKAFSLKHDSKIIVAK
jgi:hypothetical protein